MLDRPLLGFTGKDGRLIFAIALYVLTLEEGPEPTPGQSPHAIIVTGSEGAVRTVVVQDRASMVANRFQPLACRVGREARRGLRRCLIATVSTWARAPRP